MGKRINIILPDETLAVLDRVAPKGARSQFISRAVLHFIESQRKGALRDRLKSEALANSLRDTQLAVEWFTLDEEAHATTSPSAQSLPRSRKSKIA